MLLRWSYNIDSLVEIDTESGILSSSNHYERSENQNSKGGGGGEGVILC